jgi:hypothetical protein
VTAAQGLPGCLAWIAERVDARIDLLLSAEADRWTALDPDLAAPLTAMRELVMAGGKRLRPSATGRSSGPAVTATTRPWSTRVPPWNCCTPSP